VGEEFTDKLVEIGNVFGEHRLGFGYRRDHDEGQAMTRAASCGGFTKSTSVLRIRS
jgi:hypothetical protein